MPEDLNMLEKQAKKMFEDNVLDSELRLMGHGTTPKIAEGIMEKGLRGFGLSSLSMLLNDPGLAAKHLIKWPHEGARGIVIIGINKKLYEEEYKKNKGVDEWDTNFWSIEKSGLILDKRFIKGMFDTSDRNNIIWTASPYFQAGYKEQRAITEKISEHERGMER